MAASLKTTNYELAIYASNDITSWLVDFNGNMNKIDAQMKMNESANTGTKGEIESLKQQTTALDETTKNLQAQVDTIELNVTAKEIVTSASSNLTSKHTLIYKQGSVVNGNAYWNINKAGDTISTIDISSSSKKLVPLLLISGNPLNLPIISSPTVSNITIIGSFIAKAIEGSNIDLFMGGMVCYYNGTNTIIGYIINNIVLTSSYTVVDGMACINLLT